MSTRILRSTAVLFPALLASACHDGPNQPYPVAPPGSGGKWNDGMTPSSVGDGQAPFETGKGGTNLNVICDQNKLHMRTAELIQEPIIPPRKVAGLDLAGDDTWRGLTIEEAEHINCQSESIGDQFGDGALVNVWGDNGEVWAEYSVQTRKIDQITLFNGYLGKMTFKSPDDMHTYEIGLGTRITKDGQPYTVNGPYNPGDPIFAGQIDELFRGIIHTFAPTFPQAPAGTLCTRTGRCIAGSFGDVAYFYVPALGWAYWIDNQNAPQPTPSIPTRMDIYPVKIFPFSFANPLLKLDAEGPVARAGNLGVRSTSCDVKLGLDFKDFLNLCVETTDDANANTTEKNKLFGGISHSTERFEFDVQGIDLNFSDDQLSPDDIIHDKDRPGDGDTATEFTIDQSTLGQLQNDRDSLGNLDLHGTAAVYREYARLVRANVLSLTGTPDGDPALCVWPSPRPIDFDPRDFIAHLPAHCTGFEGFITPGAPTGAGDLSNVGIRAALGYINPSLGTGLNLGHQTVTFCDDADGMIAAQLAADPTGGTVTGYQSCQTGDTFLTSFTRLVAVFGKGRVQNLPSAVGDVRFFFQQWVTAFVKHLQHPTSYDLSSFPVDRDNLFFDSLGAGQFEIGEFVDRRFATKTMPPTDFVIIADVKNGIFALYNFSRDIFRGETVLYTAVLEDQTHGIGQENSALLTNVFGSPVLKGGWHDSSAGKSAYYCATHLDPGNCDGQVPPLDATGAMQLDPDGDPLLAQYPGAFTSTPLTLGPTKLTVTKTMPEIAQAKISLPLLANPYDPTSMAMTPLEILVPWAPKQPGIGFPVALTGTLDKFIETYQLDLSGTTITANVDYDFAIDPMTGMPMNNGAIELKAVETTDFLGAVFLCQDPSTGEILDARMYTPAAVIIDWVDSHRGVYDACGFVIRYSPFNNYVDYITSLTNGVRLGITQGGGFGRVVDATLFVPGQ
jgi:hypothetical protein